MNYSQEASLYLVIVRETLGGISGSIPESRGWLLRCAANAGFRDCDRQRGGLLPEQGGRRAVVAPVRDGRDAFPVRRRTLPHGPRPGAG